MTLGPSDQARFARHLALPEIGLAGQEKLLAARVLLVGVGGLGSAAGWYLAAAGVGHLGVMDGDRVEPSNLQRQILYAAADVGRPKADAAAEKMRALYPALDARPLAFRLTPGNAPALLADYDFVIDATDNLASKFLIADVCHAARKPYAHAGILHYCGQALTVLPGRSACYRCIFEPPPDGEPAGPPAGPLGVLPGVIGVIQATEAIKYLLGLGRLLTDRLLVYDALAMEFRVVRVRRNPACPLCGGV